MNGLSYTYPHWLYDLMMYKIYNLGGWNAIYISTIIFTIVLGISIFYTNSKLSKNKLISFIMTLIIMYLMKGYIAARAQLVTFSLFILLIYNIEKFIQSRKFTNVIAIFIIHILIANLHAAVWPFSFVLYLPYIVEYLIAVLRDAVIYSKFEQFYLKRKIKLEKKKSKNPLQYETRLKYIYNKNEKIKLKREKEKPYKIIINKADNTKWLILIFFIAILTGFLTPLGKVPFTYNYLTLIGNTMKNINEHLPLTLINNTPILCTITVLIAIITFTKTKIKLSDLFMLGGLMYLMFATRRQQSMFVLIGSVAFTRMIAELVKNNINLSDNDIIEKSFNKFTGFLIVAIVLLCSFNLYKQIYKDPYIDENTYPVQASEWILNNLDVKNIRLYNEYNYGSYLLFKGIPVFVDSRADLYAPEFNTPSGKKEDGKDIFSDFINSSSIGEYYGDTFKKYDITHIIQYKNSKITMLINKADSEKYKEIYSDDRFVIFEVGQ